jgi:hypothetical protein
MSQRLYSFLVVFLLIFSGEIFGQQNLTGFSVPKPSYSIFYKKIGAAKPTTFINTSSIYNSNVPTPKFILLNIIPASYYSSQLGFFCKKELQLDKVVAVPLRFRLGSLAYVNYLEQKPNFHNPQR